MARQLKAVFRRAGLAKPHHGRITPILFQATADGLRIQVHSATIAVEYHLPGAHAPVQFALPFAFLTACEGAKNEAVTLDLQPDGKIRASWFDRRVPQSVLFDDCRAEIVHPFPEPPQAFAENDERFLPALVAAMEIGQEESHRYALDTIQLRGPTGDMAATDSRQLLLQTGFQFAWDGEALVPHSNVFRSPEFAEHGSVFVGKTEDHAAFRIGPWQVLSLLEKTRRFPKIRNVIPAPSPTGTRFRLSAADAEFLAASLPRLPGGSDPFAPVTVECNGHLAVRARDQSQNSVTELVLSRSEVEGPAARCSMNRCFLERAIQLGFPEVQFSDPEAPLVCSDGRRHYVWQVLAPDEGGPPIPDDKLTRIDSAAPHADAPPQPTEAPEPAAISAAAFPKNRIAERIQNMPSPQTNGQPSENMEPSPRSSAGEPRADLNGDPGGDSHGVEHSDPIQAAETLRETLRQALTQTSRLVSALRRHKKQARLVQTTLASLRQLQQVG